MSFWIFFYDFAPVIPHKSQVMSVYPCLHVHICISACPCFLSCRFACPCLTFLRFCSCHTPQGPSMSAYPCLHVRKCMCACPCLLSCMFACPFGFFLRFCSCHTPQVPGHVCISLSACPYMHFCMSMFS